MSEDEALLNSYHQTIFPEEPSIYNGRYHRKQAELPANIKHSSGHE